ncbi:MAG TPA: BON domain-containing protein [Candidatus Angelobacter sp.]
MQLRAIAVLLIAAFALSAWAQKTSQPPPNFTRRVTKQVMHEILMLPDYNEFDAIGFKVEGYDVTLFGHVFHASLKSDAEHAIRRIEGVEKINNQIAVLPASPMDDRLRVQLFRAIYGYGPLQRYGIGSNRPIHIIVDHGNITLEGVVDSTGDKNLVNIRANGVPGVFSVTNNLEVPSKKKR